MRNKKSVNSTAPLLKSSTEAEPIMFYSNTEDQAFPSDYRAQNSIMSSDCRHNATNSSLSPKRLGRKRKVPLTYDFMSFRSRAKLPLKKETLRVQCIRGIKYCIRRIISGCRPQRQLIHFRSDNSEKCTIWDIMTIVVNSKLPLFTSLSSIAHGPVTEGLGKRSEEETCAPRSFNDAYCAEFYADPAMRMLHFLYMQLVFDCGDISPKAMCDKMRIRCCPFGRHSDKCQQGWESLSWYLTFTLIEDLGLQAYGALAEQRSSDTMYQHLRNQSAIDQLDAQRQPAEVLNQ